VPRFFAAAATDGPNDLAPDHNRTPPCNGVKSGNAVIVKRPLLMVSSKSFVGFLKIAEVRALPMDTLAPAAKLSSAGRNTADNRLHPPRQWKANSCSDQHISWRLHPTFFAPSKVSFCLLAVSSANVIETETASARNVIKRFIVLRGNGLGSR